MNKIKSKYIPALKWQFLTPFYDIIIKLLVPETKIKKFFFSQIPKNKNLKVLDFGSGTGKLGQMLNDEFELMDIVGIDPDPKMIKFSKNRETENLHFFEYNGSIIPYGDSTFDIVTSSWVFHHLYPNQKMMALNEIKRVLKPEGYFILADWGIQKNLFFRFLFLMVQIIDNFETSQMHKNGEFDKLLKSVGFNDVIVIKKFNTLLGNLCFWKLTMK